MNISPNELQKAVDVFLAMPDEQLLEYINKLENDPMFIELGKMEFNDLDLLGE